MEANDIRIIHLPDFPGSHKGGYMFHHSFHGSRVAVRTFGMGKVIGII